MPWAVDLKSTKSLFDYDVLVVDMRVMLNESPLFVPYEIVESKRFEAERLLSKGGIIVCLMAPEVRWNLLGLKTASYEWIPVQGLGNLIVSGEGHRIARSKSSPFDSYLDDKHIVWYAFLKQSQRVQYVPLAVNEADLAVAAKIEVGKGTIYLLPFSQAENWLDDLYLCLEKAWKKEREYREPPLWLNEMIVPQKEQVEKELSDVTSKIDGLLQRARELSKTLDEKVEILKLLYEQGSPLENAVKSAFGEIGFVLKNEGDRDLVYVNLDERVVFEVTGSLGSIDLGKLRQLFDFIQDDETRRNVTPKGVLVGNQEIATNPEKRGPPFTKAVVDRAAGFGVCLLPSFELFHAVVLFREGKLNPKRFWDELMSTKGVYTLTEGAS